MNYKPHNFHELQATQISLKSLSPQTIFRIVLQQLQYANLRVNPNKSLFTCKELRYLGFVFMKDGIRSDPKKIEAIQSIIEQRNRKELQSYLGVRVDAARIVIRSGGCSRLSRSALLPLTPSRYARILMCPQRISWVFWISAMLATIFKRFELYSESTFSLRDVSNFLCDSNNDSQCQHQGFCM